MDDGRCGRPVLKSKQVKLRRVIPHFFSKVKGQLRDTLMTWMNFVGIKKNHGVV